MKVKDLGGGETCRSIIPAHREINENGTVKVLLQAALYSKHHRIRKLLNFSLFVSYFRFHAYFRFLEKYVTVSGAVDGVYSTVQKL